MVKKPNNNNQECDMKEDLRFNIERANEIVRLAENRKYKFLEINLALVAAFSFLLVYILDVFNNGGKFSMIISMIIYFIFSSANLVYNLKEKRTQGIETSICSSRDWKPNEFEEKMKNIDNYSFKDDYIKQIENYTFS